MDDVADLQAQIVALRLAVEGVWLSVLAGDPNAVGQAERLRDANVASLDQLDAATPQARAAREAVALHTRSLWGSIVWQLQQDPSRV
ncbi:hypothetical protein [Sphingomonas sp. R86521]|uniref:hypothetical protein n=1 Tax=Sphingomonas sp. R86521 TaxID=3093860 RepID=UPI0036D2C778